MKVVQKIAIIALSVLIFAGSALAQGSALITAVKGVAKVKGVARKVKVRGRDVTVEAVVIRETNIENVKTALQNKDLTENDVRNALAGSLQIESGIKFTEARFNQEHAAPEAFAIKGKERGERQAITKLLNDWLAEHKK